MTNKYWAIVESQRVLVDCEGVSYLKLFLHIEGDVSSYISYSPEHLERMESTKYVSKFSIGDELTLVGECISTSSTHHVFIGRIVLN